MQHTINLSAILEDSASCIPSSLRERLLHRHHSDSDRQEGGVNTSSPLDVLADLLLHPCLTLKIARHCRSVLVDLVGRCRLRLSSNTPSLLVCTAYGTEIENKSSNHILDIRPSTSDASVDTSRSKAPDEGEGLELHSQQSIQSLCACQTPSSVKDSTFSRLELLLGALSNLLPVAPQLLGYVWVFGMMTVALLSSSANSTLAYPEMSFVLFDCTRILCQFWST